MEPTHLPPVPPSGASTNQPAGPGQPPPDSDKPSEVGDAYPETGVLVLRSGTWKWIAYIEGPDAAILFHDERFPNNRMRSRLRAEDTSRDAIERAGREPQRRWWEDPVGGIWEVRVEEAIPLRLEQRAHPRRRIIFTRGDQDVETELPEGRTLGELTAAELTALLYESTSR